MASPQSTLHGVPVEIGAWRPEIADPLLDVRTQFSDLIADRSRAILRIDGVGTFGVEGGERVAVAVEPDAEVGIVNAYLNSTVSALLLAQRGRFALHANCVEAQGKALAVAGDSGAGKSTTSIRLLQRGHRHLTDDFTLLEPGDGGVILHPTDRGLRLWPETAKLLGVDISGAVRQITTSEKVVLAHPRAAQARLTAAFVIERGDVPAVELRRVHGAQALQAVLTNAYRGDILRRVWPDEVFAWAGDVAEGLAVYRVVRPEEGWTVDDVVDAVEAALS